MKMQKKVVFQTVSKLIVRTFIVMVSLLILYGGYATTHPVKERFFRYEITNFQEAYDYFNDVSVENRVFSYKVDKSYLYIYGIGGYTRIHLGLKNNIIKVINEEYYKNLVLGRDGRDPYRSSLEKLQEKYGKNITMETNFNHFSNHDIQVFVRLYRERKEIIEWLDEKYTTKKYSDQKDIISTRKVFENLHNLNEALLKMSEQNTAK